MKTYSAKASELNPQWHVIDAKDLVLGRLATIIANHLRGKHKTTFTPHMNCGDFVIVVNAEKVHLTGKKMTDRKFFWHTGYPGGIKERTPKETLNSKFPERLLYKAVERMITRSPLGRDQMSRLKIYAGENHPHASQQPKVLDVAALNSKNKKRA